MSDILEIFGIEYDNVTGIIAKDSDGNDVLFSQGGGGGGTGGVHMDADGYLVLDDEGGGNDYSWLTSNTPTPNVRNFFYALINGTAEHGEFTLASTPTNEFITLFTLQNITAPQGIVFIDKDFYQGTNTLPNQSSDAIAFCWYDKAFLNPARETALGSTYPSYGYIVSGITQTSNSGNFGNGGSAQPFDGTTLLNRGYFLFDEQSLTWKSQFGGSQYTGFIANRTYIWIAY